jgi:hypothetical protein
LFNVFHLLAHSRGQGFLHFFGGHAIKCHDY